MMKMSTEIPQRRYLRFSLDIPAIRRDEKWSKIETVVHQISLGGCLISWSDDVFPGDEIRLEIPLPKGNYLPLTARVLYKFPGKGIGAKFVDITEFEQSLLAEIIKDRIEKEGLPPVDPFARPPLYIKDSCAQEDVSNQKITEERKVEQILSSEKTN